jgi:RND superfamily putative drug exporter
MRARTEEGQAGSSLARLRRQSPGLFRSGYFLLAGLDGSKPGARRAASSLINLDHGGLGARMLVIPGSSPSAPETVALIGRLQDDAAGLARETGTDAAVGGGPAIQADMNDYYRDSAPELRIVLSLVTILVLLFVSRSLAIAILAAIVNVIAVGASLGLLALFFDGSLLGGPGYVDAAVIPATVVVMFALAIDYEVFIIARMREEYVRTGSTQVALNNGLAKTAHVVTGAAVIMIAVFLAFALSELITLRNFGVALAIGVAIDAFIIRLVVMPAAIRAMGKWAWWIPSWLDRILPGESPGPRPARLAD